MAKSRCGVGGSNPCENKPASAPYPRCFFAGGGLARPPEASPANDHQDKVGQVYRRLLLAERSMDSVCQSWLRINAREISFSRSLVL